MKIVDEGQDDDILSLLCVYKNSLKNITNKLRTIFHKLTSHDSRLSRLRLFELCAFSPPFLGAIRFMPKKAPKKLIKMEKNEETNFFQPCELMIIVIIISH